MGVFFIGDIEGKKLCRKNKEVKIHQDESRLFFENGGFETIADFGIYFEILIL